MLDVLDIKTLGGNLGGDFGSLPIVQLLLGVGPSHSFPQTTTSLLNPRQTPLQPRPNSSSRALGFQISDLCFPKWPPYSVFSLSLNLSHPPPNISPIF